MRHVFQGHMSGSSLGRTRVEVHAELETGPGGSVERWVGGFLWSGAHNFAVGEEYTLELPTGIYRARVTEVPPGQVKFEAYP
jgi:hypothetical protein